MSSEFPPVPSIGSIVEHRTFGKGEIKKVSPSGLGPVVEIGFDTYGTKSLAWAYAHRNTSIIRGPDHVHV